MQNKVPEVTLGFWLIKVLATTLGETGGDTVTMSMDLGYLTGTAIFLTVLIILVGIQIAAKKFHPFLYWSVIVASTTAGTTMADLATRSLGIGYTGGSLILFAGLMATLVSWYWSQGSISVETVNRPRVEIFYWAAITLSQTLGTALGDWAADTGGLGYGGGALGFATGLAVTAALYYWTDVSRVLLFWAAFIFTRPLGATVGDLLDKPLEQGGLALSRPIASVVIAAIMIACIVLLPQKAGRHPWRSYAGDGVERKERRVRLRVVRIVYRTALVAFAAAAACVGVVYVTGNFHTVISGQLYRSGQPSAEQVADWHERYGINTIINLRGAHPNQAWYRIERAAAREYGVDLIDYGISAKRELTPAQVEELLAILARAKPPVLIHCLDGADRSGLVSAFYVAEVAKGSEFFAELQLTPLYGHIPLWFMPYYAVDRSFENAEPRLGFPNS